MRPFKWQSLMTVLIGPFATVTTALAIEVISAVAYPIPAPGAFLLLIVAAGAYVGGISSGLLCAFLTIFYVFFVANFGSAAFFGHDAIGRAFVLSICAVSMAMLVGLLRRRTTYAEARRIEAVTQLSDRRFSLLFEASPVGIIISRNTLILHANGAFFEAFGYEASEMLGKSFSSLLSPEVRDEIVSRTRRREAGEPVPSEYETIGQRKDGSEFPFLVQVSRLDLSDGPATLAFITDITARRAAEDAVLQLNRNTEFSLNSARVGSWQLDLKTRAFNCSNVCKANHGRDPGGTFSYEDFIGAAHPDDRQRVEALVQSAIDSRTGYEAEYRIVWPDQSIHWIVSRGRCSYDASGTALFLAGIVIDVTERHLAAAELRLSQERLKLAAEGAGLGMWYCDLPFDRLVWNDTCKRQFEVQPGAEVTLESFFERLHPDDRQRVSAAIDRCIADRTPYDIDYRVVGPSGRLRWIRATGRCFYDASGAPIRFDGITVDLTEHKRFEEELETARKAAETASAAKDHFLAVLSHELRTPLTPVLASVQSMELEPTLASSMRESLEVVRRNVELEARLIDDLLDLTRIAKGKLRLDLGAADAHELLRQAIAICTVELKRKGLELSVDLRADRHHVLADPARLQQVYWNLINNAVKFTPAGGRIVVTTCNDGPRLRVEVIDNGIGIEPATLPRLFHAFEQARETFARSFGGLGLGLTISKSLVDMHGGVLTAYSDGPGRGARLTVDFPTVAAPAPPPDLHPVEPRRGADPGLHILLVDDHEDTNRALRRLLQQLGYRVHCAFSVKSALEAAGQGDFDLLISDIGLPDGSGLDLMRQLLADRKMKPLKGIALSGFGMEDDVRKSLEAGFKDHLTKPVSFQKLEAAIRELAH